MDPIRDFDADLKWVLDACEKRISTYPPALGRSGRAFLEKWGLLNEKNVGGFSISYLLPFWLKETFDLDHETCRLIALGNSFWLLYFLIQDTVMDTGPGEYQGHLIPLGSLVYLDAITPYRSLFGPDSPFWTFFEQYIVQWAESVLWEREQHWGQAREFEEGDLLRLAFKAAGLKIPCAALSLLAGREEAIGPLEKMVDDVHVVFRLADDLADWREDLAQGNYTHFLIRVMAHQGIRSAALLTDDEVEKALFVGGILEESLDLMAEYNQKAIESISTLHAPYLKAYLALLDQECQRSKAGFQEERAQWIREQFAFLVQESYAP